MESQIGVCCAKCVAPINVRTMEDCIECPDCGFTFCTKCYDPTLGDGCRSHGAEHAANPWELYSSMPGWQTASNAISAAWEQAKLLRPELPSKERANLAERHVAAVLEQYRDFGATDTEPMATLAERVEQHFGVQGGYI